ncbi:hypothetical protein CHX27_05350 [Flavobacterium aurantiibacter]|uniref:Uncharacterized protein n=1 Tax=Flavobacterium aurantiibacter TaxID=2023067 RepID=A0A255ZX29_9FLAO|nr:hypothetical protein CHX27_05350 [Flavobacterium aurantiibacter]
MSAFRPNKRYSEGHDPRLHLRLLALTKTEGHAQNLNKILAKFQKASTFYNDLTKRISIVKKSLIVADMVKSENFVEFFANRENKYREYY